MSNKRDALSVEKAYFQKNFQKFKNMVSLLVLCLRFSEKL